MDATAWREEREADVADADAGLVVRDVAVRAVVVPLRRPTIADRATMTYSATRVAPVAVISEPIGAIATSGGRGSLALGSAA